MKPFKHVVYLCKKWHPNCNYQLQPKTPRKCVYRSCTCGLCFSKCLRTKKENITCPSPFFFVLFTQSTSVPFYNSTSIFSHDKLLQGSTSRLRTKEGVVLQDLVKHCTLTPRANKFICGEGSFWIQLQSLSRRNKIREENICCKGAWDAGTFFFLEGWKIVGFCLFMGLFYCRSVSCLSMKLQ